MPTDWQLEFNTQECEELEKLKGPNFESAAHSLWMMNLEPERRPPHLPSALRELAGDSFMGNVIALGTWYALRRGDLDDDELIKEVYQRASERIYKRCLQKPFDLWKGRGTPEKNLIAFCRRVAHNELITLWQEEIRHGHRTDTDLAAEALGREVRRLRGQKDDDPQVQKRLGWIRAYKRCIRNGIEPHDFERVEEMTGISQEKIQEIYEQVIRPYVLEQQRRIEEAMRCTLSAVDNPLREVIRAELCEEIREIANTPKRRWKGKRRAVIRAIADNLEAGCDPFDRARLIYHLNKYGVTYPNSNALDQAVHRAKKILKEELKPDWWNVLQELRQVEQEQLDMSLQSEARDAEEDDQP